MSKQDHIDDIRHDEQESINEELMRVVEDDFAEHQRRSKDDCNG
jgi:hypothetical protein